MALGDVGESRATPKPMGVRINDETQPKSE